MVKDGYLNKFYVFSSYILSRIKSFQVFTNTTAKQGGKYEESDYSP